MRSPGAVGIPTYGVPGVWQNSDGNGTHGLNERLEVLALYTDRDFLTELVRDWPTAEKQTAAPRVAGRPYVACW